MAKREGKTENLIPLNKRSKDEQRAIQSKGGKASGKSRREQILISKIFSDYLLDTHEIVLKDSEGKPIKKEKLTAKELINRTISGVMAREDSASVSLIKEIREATEGNNLTVETDNRLTIDFTE
jgi:tRNA splicing endonuclease